MGPRPFKRRGADKKYSIEVHRKLWEKVLEEEMIPL